MSSNLLTLRPVKPSLALLNFFVILLLGATQYYWINLFYALISSDMARDLPSYQVFIDDLGSQPFEWDLFLPEMILYRTFVYGEFFSSIIFQITGALNGTATELHAATIVMLTLTSIFLQLNRRTNISLVILITFACPFLFSNLLLGNTRQLWGCIIILLFYGRTPLFEYFKSCSLIQLAPLIRIILFSLIILGTHIGSIFVFVTILVIDYFLAIYTKYGVPRLCILVKFFGRFILFAVVLFIGYKLLSQINWLSLIQSKFDFYWGEKELDSYPYLSGGFFYLVILPLSVDVFLYLRRKSSINPLCFVLLMVWFLICLTFMLPISHGLDRIITALLLLGYIKRLKMGGLRYEYIYTFIRLLALLYYIIVR